MLIDFIIFLLNLASCLDLKSVIIVIYLYIFLFRLRSQVKSILEVIQSEKSETRQKTLVSKISVLSSKFYYIFFNYYTKSIVLYHFLFYNICDVELEEEN